MNWNALGATGPIHSTPALLFSPVFPKAVKAIERIKYSRLLSGDAGK